MKPLLTSSSSFFHMLDMSHMDLEHTGHVYLQDKSLFLSVMTSFIGCMKRLVCFTGYAAPYLWCIVNALCDHISTPWYLLWNQTDTETQIKTLLCFALVTKIGLVWFFFYLKTNRAIVMHCAFHTSVLVFHDFGVATSCPKKIRCRNKHLWKQGT